MDLSLLEKKEPFFFAISGYKHTGKTTLIDKLLPILTGKGYLVAVIKHDGHDFEGDVPGTDSYKHKAAGAYASAVFSKSKVLIQKECEGIDERMIAAAFPEADIILLEGFKNSDYPGYLCKYPKEPLIAPERLVERIIEKLKEEREEK